MFLRLITLGLLLATIITATTPAPHPGPKKPLLKYCSKQPYYETDYTCYHGSKLCPIEKKVPSYPCGHDCYFLDQYICHDDEKMCPLTAPHICETPEGVWNCFDPIKYKCQKGVLGPVTI